MQFLKYWQYILAALAILILSCFISYCIGVSDGREQEQSTQLVVGAKEGNKSQVLRENIEHETRNLSHTDIDNQLDVNGWMRSDTDN